MMTHGSINYAELRGPAEHCVERLIERADVKTLEEASRLYLSHHKRLTAGEGEWLYKSPRGGSVYKIADEKGRVFYPVRRKSKSSTFSQVTVTYLSAAMVFDAMMEQGAQRFHPEQLDW